MRRILIKAWLIVIKIFSYLFGRKPWVYGTVYILMIPLFAFIYNLTPETFYLSTVKSESEYIRNLEIDIRNRLKEQIERYLIIGPYRGKAISILLPTIQLVDLKINHNILEGYMFISPLLIDISAKNQVKILMEERSLANINYLSHYYRAFADRNGSVDQVLFEKYEKRKKELNDTIEKLYQVKGENNTNLYYPEIQNRNTLEMFLNNSNELFRKSIKTIRTTEYDSFIPNEYCQFKIQFIYKEDGESIFDIIGVEITANELYKFSSIFNSDSVLNRIIKHNETYSYMEMSNTVCFDLEEDEILIKKIEELKRLLEGYSSSSKQNFKRMFYFSTVTITTLGFGDIVPITDKARLLTSLEAILGVVVIGLFLNSIYSKKDKS